MFKKGNPRFFYVSVFVIFKITRDLKKKIGHFKKDALILFTNDFEIKI